MSGRRWTRCQVGFGANIGPELVIGAGKVIGTANLASFARGISRLLRKRTQTNRVRVPGTARGNSDLHGGYSWIGGRQYLQPCCGL